MSEVKVNKISPRTNCGTVQLGDSGDTITIPAGATITNNGTQTGFGRTGTVDWDTTAKTASFTAVSGNGYFVNTTSGAITMTLPATPSAGDIVSVKDYAGTFATNNLTIARNGSNLDGNAGDKVVSTNFQNFTMVYVDGTQGWIATGSGSDSIGVLPSFITATGGTETTCGNFKIHTFTGPGTFTVCSVGNPIGSTTVDYMVVAGGGGGAGGYTSSFGAGGGGAGGFRESSGAASGCYTASPLGACVSALPVSVQGYPITVGGGGSGRTSPAPCGAAGAIACAGSNSVFSTITSAGGGAGSMGCSAPCGPHPQKNGGSGGGQAGSNCIQGTGNTPPVSPPQGNPGGPGTSPGTRLASGGGGATQVGQLNPAPNSGGDGGDGATTSISATPTAYAGGGAGGARPNCGGTAGTGGTGGGGNGGQGSTPGSNGTTNTGGGGGGAGPNACNSNGANGGSGIVIIRYKYQ